jgi:hypothetical protein
VAGEIRHRHDLTGVTLYAFVLNLAGQVRDVVAGAWDAFAVADIGDYDIALSESPASGYRYAGDAPAGLVAGTWYRIEIYEQAGAAPAITDQLLASGWALWDGTYFRPALPLVVNGSFQVQIDPGQDNTSDNDPTHIGGQLRRTHALAGGTKATKDHAAANPTWVHRNEADSAALVTRTRTVATQVETETPT